MARPPCVMPCTEWLASPAGRLQGGAIAMLADFAMLIAVREHRPLRGWRSPAST